MNPLTAYLEKFRVLLNDGAEKKRIIAEAITETLKFPLTAEQVTIKGETIYISSTPAMKNELFMHRKSISIGLEKALKQKVVIR